MGNVFKYVSALVCAMLLFFTVGCGAEPQAKDVPLDIIMQNIRDAYGDAYIPNMDIPGEVLEGTYGLLPDMYEDVRGEMAAISTHPDVVIVVKAKEGKDGDVQAALNQAMRNAIENSLMYPMNIPKVNASQVITTGNYCAFLMVGANYSGDDVESDEAAEFARNETQKAVEAFNKSFQ